MDWKDDLIKLQFPIDPNKIRTDQAVALKFQHIPKRLFQFNRCSGHGIQNFANMQIWLCFPDKLNDPFDCSLTYSMEVIGYDYFRFNLDALIDRMGDKFRFTNEDRKKLRESSDILHDLALMAARQDQTVKSEDSYKLASLLSDAAKHVLRSMPMPLADGVKASTLLSSFTERLDSILMWSHYAEYHTGFCVEYDFPSLGIKSPTSRLLYPVIYSEKLLDVTEYLRPIGVNRLLHFNNTIGLYAAIIKSREWEYEKEWRFVLPFGIYDKEMAWKNIPLPKAVYLGAKISQDNSNIITEIARKANIPILNCIPSKVKFRLDFVEKSK